MHSQKKYSYYPEYVSVLNNPQRINKLLLKKSMKPDKMTTSKID